ncbi:MAG: hypothetical protein KDD67_16965 [Ignavibacteriae bacterium]|nr:hypothetical protein [Ignavibacteriota bacterium]
MISVQQRLPIIQKHGERYETILSTDSSFSPLLDTDKQPPLAAESQLTVPLEVEGQLHDIVFRNTTEGYGLSDELVWETRDGGETWKQTLPLVFRPPFTAMATFGEEGMIIGDNRGGIHVRSHAEDEWITTQPTNDEPIKEIEVLDKRRWTAITASTVFVTNDGGATYRQFSPPEGGGLSAVDITDASLMHICESMYYIWRSSNSGKTWNRLDDIQFGFGILYDAQFISADTALVASWYPWNLFTTFDGGKNWHRSPFDYPTSIAVASNGLAAYTASGFVRLSYDHGKTCVNSINVTELGTGEGVTAWDYQKIVALDDNGLILLLSNSEGQRSVIAKINVDLSSSVIESKQVTEGELDLSVLTLPVGIDIRTSS